VSRYYYAPGPTGAGAFGSGIAEGLTAGVQQYQAGQDRQAQEAERQRIAERQAEQDRIAAEQRDFERRRLGYRPEAEVTDPRYVEHTLPGRTVEMALQGVPEGTAPAQVRMPGSTIRTRMGEALREDWSPTGGGYAFNPAESHDFQTRDLAETRAREIREAEAQAERDRVAAEEAERFAVLQGIRDAMEGSNLSPEQMALARRHGIDPMELMSPEEGTVHDLDRLDRELAVRDRWHRERDNRTAARGRAGQRVVDPASPEGVATRFAQNVVNNVMRDRVAEAERSGGGVTPMTPEEVGHMLVDQAPASAVAAWRSLPRSVRQQITLEMAQESRDIATRLRTNVVGSPTANRPQDNVNPFLNPGGLPTPDDF